MQKNNREFKQTMMTTKTTMSPNKDLVSSTSTVVVQLHYYPCMILSFPLQNSKVKWPISGYFAEPETESLICHINIL